METGNVRDGGDLPTIGFPVYVEMLDDVKERLQAYGERNSCSRTLAKVDCQQPLSGLDQTVSLPLVGKRRC